MREVPLGKFREHCFAMLNSVQKTRQPVLITRHGRPLAKLVPVDETNAGKFPGRLEGIVKVIGDVESPIWFSS